MRIFTVNKKKGFIFNISKLYIELCQDAFFGCYNFSVGYRKEE